MGEAKKQASHVADAAGTAARKTANSFETAARELIENQPYTAVGIALAVFMPSTIARYLAVVDPGVGSDRRCLVLQDAAGRRYLVDETNVYSVLASGEILF